MSRRNAYAAPHWAASQRVGDVGTKATLLTLANYADEEFSCYPSQATLAEETEQSPRTIWKQVKWLESVGLIRRERRYDGQGHRKSDRFYLQLDVVIDVRERPDLLAKSADRPTRTQGASGDEGPTRNATREPYSQPGCEGTPSEPPEQDSPNGSSCGDGAQLSLLPDPQPPTSAERGRKPDVVWDALMAVCAVDTSSITASSRGAYNRAVKELRQAGATPEEITRRAAIFRATWPDIRLTPTALVRRWSEVGDYVGNGGARRLREQVEADDLAARMRAMDEADEQRRAQ